MTEENKAVDEKLIFADYELVGENPKSIAGDDEIDKGFLKRAKIHFDRFSSQRTPYEDLWDVYDHMYKGGPNRTIQSSEEGLGANLQAGLDIDGSVTRAQLGSPLLHRLITQMCAQYMAVYLSRAQPFKYSPIVNPRAYGSDVESEPDAEVANLYAKWTLRRNNDSEGSHNFATSIYKNGNVPEMVYWQKETLGDVEYGYTKFEQFPLRNLWADVNGGPLERQHCVITCSPATFDDIQKGTKDREYDSDQCMKITRQYLWDGVWGTNADTEQTNQGLDTNSLPSDTGLYLKWEIFMLTGFPDKGNPQRWWATVIGNTIEDGIIIRLEVGRDPDGENPFHMSHANPDDTKNLYHVAPADIIRSNYSLDCTLKSQIVDEGTASLLAPDIIREGAFPNQTDFKYTGKPWECQGDPDGAMKRHQTGSASQMAMNLLEYIRDESRNALSMDKPFTGEEFGSRTSATEAGNIFRTSSQPILAGIRYIMNQGSRWKARKILSYGYAFAKEETMIAVTDDKGTVRTIKMKKDINRAFDIDIDIVDEFENTVLRRQAVNEKVGIIASSPELSKEVDIPELVREWFEIDKLPSTRLVNQRTDFDALNVAEEENLSFASGRYLPPQEGQDQKAHIPRHNAFVLSYEGFFPDNIPPGMHARSIEFAKQHIAESQAMDQNARAPAPKGQRNQTEGQATGNAQAAALGGAQGG